MVVGCGLLAVVAAVAAVAVVAAVGVVAVVAVAAAVAAAAFGGAAGPAAGSGYKMALLSVHSSVHICYAGGADGVGIDPMWCQ